MLEKKRRKNARAHIIHTYMKEKKNVRYRWIFDEKKKYYYTRFAEQDLHIENIFNTTPVFTQSVDVICQFIQLANVISPSSNSNPFINFLTIFLFVLHLKFHFFSFVQGGDWAQYWINENSHKLVFDKTKTHTCL